MKRYEVTMVMCRTIKVQVEARTVEGAKGAALSRGEWIETEGTRAPLKLLAITETKEVVT
jgi:hypothetical protein